ncbi:MAG TPA: trypsin-like serine protease [Gaiellaceae bacterium]
MASQPSQTRRAASSISFAFLLAIVMALSLWAPQNAFAIYDGDIIFAAPPWSAYVTSNQVIFGHNIGWETACSGSIVSSEWVLTAAHCVVTADKSGNSTSTLIDLSKIRVVLGRNDLRKTYQGGQWTVTQVELDPAWNPATKAGDAALLHLKGPLAPGALPMPLAPSGFQIADGASADAFGYGHTNETYSSDGKVLSYTDSHQLRVTKSDSYEKVSGCDPNEWCFGRVGDSEVLHGDSGGPWVRDKANLFMVGVLSVVARFSPGANRTGFYALAGVTNVAYPPLHSWITTNADIYQPSVGVIYRNRDTGSAWLMGSDGFRHDIQTGEVYNCLTSQNHDVVNLDAFTLAELPRSTTPAVCVPATGDLFVGTGLGQIAKYRPDGTPDGTLDTTTSSYEDTGMCFDSAGNLYATNFQDRSLSKFNSSGQLLEARWATFGSHPESCAVRPNGNVLVGQVDGPTRLTELDSSGTVVREFSPATEDRGVDWIDLTADGCTLRYSSEGSSIKQFDVCTDSQLADFAAGLPQSCYALRNLADGGAVVACASAVQRLDSTGHVTRSYTPIDLTNGTFYFALTLDATDGVFWTATYAGTVSEVDLATGDVLKSFVVPVATTLGGLAVRPG